MSKKILILGADGFVGRAVSKKLSGGGNNLYLVSRNKSFRVAGAKIFYGDLANLNFCRQILKNADIVYYLAGFKKNIYFHTKTPWDFFVGNTKSLINFLEALKCSPVKKVVYLSSVAVDYFKDDIVDGYVFGKHVNELLISTFVKQFGVDIKIIRSAPIYGPGDNFNQDSANFIPATIRKVDESRCELLVWGKGIRKLQFIYIDDLVDNLIEASKNPGNFFIFGNSEVLSINKIVMLIIKILNKKLIVKYDIGRPSKETKLNKFLNLVPPRFDIQSGLANTIKYFKNE